MPVNIDGVNGSVNFGCGHGLHYGILLARSAYPMRVTHFFAGISLLLLANFGGCNAEAATRGDDSDVFGRVIRKIEYAANPPLEPSHFDLRLRPDSILTRTALKDAIQALYSSGRFSWITADAFEEGDGVRVRFTLRYSYYFNQFSLVGGVNLGGRSLWEVVSLPTGERFTSERLEGAREAVLDYMHDRGYFLAKVEAVPKPFDHSHQVDTVFKVQPGDQATVSSVDIQGVPKQDIENVRERLGLKKGETFDRRRLRRRLDNLKDFFLKRGYLAAVAQATDSFEPANNTVALAVKVSNFGRIRVTVDGFKIDRNQLRSLLPILTGEGINEDILDEGAQNIRDYLEEHGYPEAEVTINEEEDKSETRVVRYSVNTGHKVTVAYVSFKGNRAFSSQELFSIVQIQPARLFQKSVYSVAKLDGDVDSLKTLYQSRGYLDASVITLVKPVEEGQRLGITFEITEGKQARARLLPLKGNQTLKSEVLLPKMRLKTGSPYSPSLVEQDRQTLLATYNDAGFMQATVTYRVAAPDSDGSYPIEFNITEGTRTYIDNVVILGNDRTRDSVIERHVLVKSNDPLSLGKLLKSQQELYNTGVFDLVRVVPQNPESASPYQNVVVRLQEAKRFTFRYGLGYQERERLRGTLELTDLNILGTARRADLTLRGSAIEKGAALSFQQPQFRFLPVDSYLTFSGLQRRDVGFDQTRLSLSYQYGHSLSGHSWALARYTFNNVRLSNLSVSPSELGREDTPRNLSTFSAIYINDTRDSYLDPEKGFFTSTDLSVTTKLLGSNDYLSLFTQNSYYRRLPASLLFAGSLRIGAKHPFGGDTTIPISERFFAGGGSSLRGFDTDFAGPLDPVAKPPVPVGGNSLIIANLEVRVPLFSAVRIASFYDSGNVFRNVSDTTLRGFSHTIGIGIRVKTPFGPLRADYGYNLNLSSDLRARGLTPGHFFITIGPPF
ncbi:MAG TPA: outer membrane protein assembly factor BamA [Acidobacteriota bacterium]|nr:outer membrane protein assembly factor BamA [Acidobacteriota bacterium]